MAIKVSTVTVINDSRQLENITNLKTIGGQSILGTGNIDFNTVGANWSFAQVGSDLVFRFNGTAVMKLTSSGQIIAINDVTAYGSM